MKKVTSMSMAALVGSALLMTSSLSFAGDCKKVKFNITNGLNSSIKVKNMRVTGNDGVWTENLQNKRIDPNQSKRFGPRKMNKLDSGSNGVFVVNYKRLNAGTGRWDNQSREFNGRCSDGMTYSFNIR